MFLYVSKTIKLVRTVTNGFTGIREATDSGVRRVTLIFCVCVCKERGAGFRILFFGIMIIKKKKKPTPALHTKEN